MKIIFLTLLSGKPTCPTVAIKFKKILQLWLRFLTVKPGRTFQIFTGTACKQEKIPVSCVFKALLVEGMTRFDDKNKKGKPKGY